ncbi:hypothetical protein [Phormidium sp. CCY1219]|uniref:hypothetical protein n=1 Tax=Phormidium sp. CCY1219 TaxID=2886104 RepID=UPI002D774029|nr:hypothetical protein [Phormidium sp. CCY1219]
MDPQPDSCRRSLAAATTRSQLPERDRIQQAIASQSWLHTQIGAADRIAITRTRSHQITDPFRQHPRRTQPMVQQISAKSL